MCEYSPVRILQHALPASRLGQTDLLSYLLFRKARIASIARLPGRQAGLLGRRNLLFYIFFRKARIASIARLSGRHAGLFLSSTKKRKKRIFGLQSSLTQKISDVRSVGLPVRESGMDVLIGGKAPSSNPITGELQALASVRAGVRILPS